MAEHSKTYFTCDRCGVEMDAPVIGSERGPESIQMSASFDVGVAGGDLFRWKHLCLKCNSAASKIARDIAADAKRLREETAKRGKE